MLVELGVDVNAIDIGGNNAFHFMLLSLYLNLGMREEVDEYISWHMYAVNLLIEAGTDLHHQNDRGDSPSRDAYGWGLWKEWCRALRYSGVDIWDILEVESYWTADIDWSEENDWSDEQEESFQSDSSNESDDSGGSDGLDEGPSPVRTTIRVAATVLIASRSWLRGLTRAKRTVATHRCLHRRMV